MSESMRQTDTAMTAGILAGAAARRMGGTDKAGLPCAAAVRRRIERGLLTVACPGEDSRVEAIGPEDLATYDPDGLMFANVNTPHDYERAKSVMDRMPGSDAAMGNRIMDARSSPLPARAQGPRTR